MVHLIVGYGQIGKALHKILRKGHYKALWVDRKDGTWNGQFIDIVHICIPYTDDFNDAIEFWKTGSKLVIVHSTVPIGTCDKLGVVHSPINGVHPHLDKGIKTFVKYFGGKGATKAARIFKDLGIKTKTFKEARTTEAMKLWSTTQYGRMIMLEKEIYEWCQKNNLNFDDVYTRSNKDYNEGYTKLGMPQVVRPYLKHIEGPIGGHCVVPNAKLLKVKI